MARCLNVDPAEFDGGPNLYWYIGDALSTVRLVVDGSGAVVASYASDEFGNQTAATGSADLRQHTYTGGLGVRDDGAALGLLYARQRYYDPSVGRWLNADPIGFSGGLNLYTYVGNRPTNFTDPNGLSPFGPPWSIPKDWNWFRDNGHNGYNNTPTLPTNAIPIKHSPPGGRKPIKPPEPVNPPGPGPLPVPDPGGVPRPDPLLNILRECEQREKDKERERRQREAQIKHGRDQRINRYDPAEWEGYWHDPNNLPPSVNPNYDYFL